MPVRNHITYIHPASVVAKAQNDQVTKKATGEVKTPDPKNAEAMIQKHLRKDGNVNPNTQLDTMEKKVATGEIQDPAKKDDKTEKKDISTKEALTVAHPVTSQAEGGKKVEDTAKK